MSQRSKKDGISKLPPALAKRARSAAQHKLARLRARARELVDLVARRRRAISEAYYDMGEALRELKQKEMLAAMGRASFTELCEKDCRISPTVADGLIQIVSTMTRDQAIGVDRSKALALIDLSRATDVRDTPAGLGRRSRVQLADGEVLDPRHASGRAIAGAARRLRQRRAAKQRGARHGRTTTAAERALARQIERRLHRLGVRAAKVMALATRPGRTSDLRIEHVPCDRVDALARAIAEISRANEARAKRSRTE